MKSNKESKILRVVCSQCKTLNLIPMSFEGEHVKCEKCGKILVERERQTT